MLCPQWRAQSPHGQLFDHHLFAHGRLFYRYQGSEACRFSPQAAFRLLGELTTWGDGPATLWDPFCGTGFILTVAAAFFPHRFPVLVGSDVRSEAAACTAANLALFSDPDALAVRLEELERLMRPSPSHARRWGEVRAYLSALMAARSWFPRAAYTLVTSAAQTPRVTDAQLVILGDLPYGRTSHLVGARSYHDCLAPLLAAHPQARVVLIGPGETDTCFLRLADGSGRHLQLRRFRGGRLQATFAAVGGRVPVYPCPPRAATAAEIAAADDEPSGDSGPAESAYACLRQSRGLGMGRSAGSIPDREADRHRLVT